MKKQLLIKLIIPGDAELSEGELNDLVGDHVHWQIGEGDEEFTILSEILETKEIEEEC
jgi:hypothetical protein